MRMVVGRHIKTWIMHVVDNLDTVDAHDDKHIWFRMAKYVNCKRMVSQWSKMLRRTLICSNAASCLRKISLWTNAAPKRREAFQIWRWCRWERNKKIRDAMSGASPWVPAPTTSQDELQLGADASSLLPLIPLNQTTCSTSQADQHYARLEAIAEQMRKEKEDR